MARNTDHTLKAGDQLALKNVSTKPMEIEVQFEDGAEVTAVLPQGGEMKFQIGRGDAEIKVTNPDED